MEKATIWCFHKPQKLKSYNTWRKMQIVFFFIKSQTIMSNAWKKLSRNKFSQNHKNSSEVYYMEEIIFCFFHKIAKHEV